MKIIKKHCIETWYSPRRFMEQNTSAYDYYHDTGDKQWYVFLEDKNDVFSYRKIGPSSICKNYITWTNRFGYGRKDGPAEIAKYIKYWDWNDYGFNEETYWNK